MTDIHVHLITCFETLAPLCKPQYNTNKFNPLESQLWVTGNCWCFPHWFQQHNSWGLMQCNVTNMQVGLSESVYVSFYGNAHFINWHLNLINQSVCMLSCTLHIKLDWTPWMSAEFSYCSLWVSPCFFSCTSLTLKNSINIVVICSKRKKNHKCITNN